MSALEGEYEFENKVIESEDDMIDRLNKRSFWKIYLIVILFYIGCAIWFGFAIQTAYQNGAGNPVPVTPPITPTKSV